MPETTTTRREWTDDDDDGTHYVVYYDAGGSLHRIGGPAVTTTNRNGSQCKAWWEDGKFIRSEWTPAPDKGDATVGAADEE